MSGQLVCVFIGADGHAKLTVNSQGKIQKWTLSDDALRTLAKDCIDTICARKKTALKTALEAKKPTG